MAEFRPQWDEGTLRKIISSYKQNPSAYPETYKQTIQQHADYHGVPFYPGEFSIADALTDLGAGFIEGFTTLHIGEEPDNEYEAIFKNLGHLAGFAPGIISAPLSAAAKVTKSASLLTAANMARKLNDKSVPMFAAKKATEFAKKNVKPFLQQGRLAKHSAVKTASDFMLGQRARHIAEGAFHLGTASAVSAWQGGVDQMMSAFVQGGAAGGVFRSIGNFINTGDKMGDKIAKTLSGSLFMGLPSTIQGATTPEQVYQYVMGAWFGGQERPWTVAKGAKYMEQFVKDAKDNPQLRVAMDPTESPKWKELPIEAQEVTKEMFTQRFGNPEQNRAAVWHLAEKLGVDVETASRQLEDLGAYQEVAGPEGTKVRLKPGSLAEFGNFVITSGQKGLESFIARLGYKRKDRIANINMVTADEAKYIKKKETPGVTHKLGSLELAEANQAITQADNVLGRLTGDKPPKNLDLIRKNYFVVKNADALYLSGNLLTYTNPKTKKKYTSKRMLAGAPGWAAQMAVDMKKPVYVYETKQKKWMKYKPSAKGFAPELPSKPPRAMGFISGSFVSKDSKEAFRGLFDKYFPEEIKPKEVEKAKEIEADEKDLKHLEDADTGSQPTNNKEVGIAAFRFVKNYMKNAPAFKGLAPGIKETTMLETMDKLHNLIPKYKNEPGETGNRSESLLKDIQEEFKFQLSGRELEDAQGFLRQWLSRVNNDKPIKHLTADGDSERIYSMSDDNPVNAAGQRKLNREPDKIIDSLWQKLTGKKERAFAVLDHIVIRDKSGNKEIDISRYRNHWKYGEDSYNRLLSRGMQHWAKEENGGFYYFGGKGADDRLYFMKYHPKTNDVKTTDVKRFFNRADYFQLKEDFVKRFSKFHKVGLTKRQAREYFDKAFKSNLLWTLETNGLEYNNTNIKKILGQGFIGDAKGWNKRSQIWLTDSYAGDKEFYQGKGLELENGNFKYMIEADLTPKQQKLNHKDVSLKSSENPESMDGAITVRDDVIDILNLDAGQPASGQNKSFIISPHNERGALLGKYMFHSAGKEQSDVMKESGLHMIIHDSAAKQMGTRKLNTEYQLDPSHIKFNYSVKQGPEMVNNQALKKQLLNSLVEALAFSPKTKDGVNMNDIVNDIFDTMIEPRYKGTEEANAGLEAYLRKLSTASDKELMRELDKLDWDNIGLGRLVTAMHQKGNQLFARKAYDIMLAKRKESLIEEFEAGELDAKLYKEEMAELEDFNSLTNRMINEGRKAAIERGKPENQLAIFTHNFVNDYRMKVLSNWVINQATKPKINNSGAARMRPYDRFLREESDHINPRLKKLETDDTLFFLDNAYRDKIIETELLGRKKLGELWDLYENPNTPKNTKKELEKVFRSAVMRVPMDSISGTQILKFSGFTGRKGHGILLHSRVMRALGGADLDGDAAYFYMGGKGGFKESWKDMYEANKEEYYKKEKGKTIVTENKDPEIIKDLVSDKKRGYDVDSKAGMFAPNARLDMSLAATDGRNLLGGAAVSPKQIMASAYNVIANRGSDEFQVNIREKRGKKWFTNTYDIKITPKNSPKEKDYIRNLTRAMVGLSSDPMDFAGLKNYEQLWRMMYKAHFNIESINKNGKKVKNIDKEFDEMPIFKFKEGGVLGMMNDANSAYYGRDYNKNRNYTMDERQEMTSRLMFEDAAEINTMTPKIARLLHSIDYSDTPLRRLDTDKVEQLFNIYNETVSQYDGMKDILGRTSFKLPYHTYIDKTMKFKLFDGVELDKVANDNHKFREVIHKTSIHNTPEKLNKTEREFTDSKGKTIRNPRWYKHRVDALRDIRDKAGAFIMKDLTTLITVRKVKEIMDKMSPDELRNVERIHKSVERLKRNSYLMARLRRKYDPDLQQTANKDPLDLAQFLKEHDIPQLSFLLKGSKKASATAELDQAQIDAEIRSLKRGSFTTKNQRDLFDTLMLGTVNRGDLAAIDAFEAKMGKMDELAFRVLSSLRQDAAKTSLSRLGYNSKEVNDKNLRDFLGDMSDVYTEISEHRAPKEVRKQGQTLVEEPQKQENIEKGMPEYFNKDMEDFLTTTTGWEGIRKPKDKTQLDPETKSYIDDVLTHLKTENNKVSEDFNLLVRNLLHKDISLMNKSDWAFMKNYFDEVKNGTIWQRFKKQQFTKLSKRHYMQFPETINRELMKDEIVLMQEQGVFLTADGIMKTGKVAKPTQYMDVLQDWIGRTNDAAIGKGDELTHRLETDLRFLDNLNDAPALHEVAIALREQPMTKNILGRKEKKSGVNFADAEAYNELLKNTMEVTNYEKALKDKIYTVTIEGERQRLRGEEVVKKINETYTKFFRDMHDIVTGDVPKDSRGDVISPIPKSLEKYIVGYYDKAKTSPKIDHIKFIHDLKKGWLEGKAVPLEFGVDGIRKVARSMMIEMMPKSDIKKDIMQTETGTTGKIEFENYWPHMHFNKKAALDALKRYTKHLNESELPREEVEKILKSMTYRHHALTGDWNFEDINDWQHFDILTSIAAKRKDREDSINWFKNLRKAGSMFSRDAHIPGWSLERQVPSTYAKSIVNNYFRQMAQIFGRNTINDFQNTMFKKFGKEQTEAWSTFMKLYAQGAMGNPDVVPEQVLNDPKMSMRGTPYAWWADNRVKDRLNKIGDTLGLLKRDIPENLRGLDLNNIRAWSNLEAKFELASLLAHPKSVVNNLFGGTMHTIQSTGFRTWRAARNPKILASINPKWTSLQAVDEFVVKHGVLPEYLMSEYGLAREFQSVKNKKFITDIARYLRKDPDLSRESVLELAKKREITKPFAEFAAKFMSVPERALRRDAFMSHYIHWYNKLGGAIKDFDHPILIELAKKGVKGTQFLYSAPYRPMFARTALGKIMTRFQLWGWNAVRFRKEALKQARLYGFEGSEADRAARMMQMDLFVFALGNAFAYSLFETAMPAPWNWVQDSADWIFGDEKERNRAFFGQWPRAIAPLQTVTPPILRLPISSMRAMLEDDWSRVADYYVYTMFPFGRIIRDLHGPNNLIENPMNIVDKWTGIPVISATKASKDLRKGEDRSVPTPGAFY